MTIFNFPPQSTIRVVVTFDAEIMFHETHHDGREEMVYFSIERLEELMKFLPEVLEEAKQLRNKIVVKLFTREEE